MKRYLSASCAVVLTALFSAFSASAQVAGPTAAALPPQAPAPLGVFGVDMPGAGKVVFAVLPSFTRMQGSKIGANSVSADYIVSNVVSADTPVGRHLLRMVPHSLSVDTEGFSVAYGLTRNITLVASTALLQKSVNMEAAIKPRTSELRTAMSVPIPMDQAYNTAIALADYLRSWPS